MSASENTIPIVDVGLLESTDEGDLKEATGAIHRACTDCGFFYITGHDVPRGLQEELDQLSRDFFALDLDEKMAIRMGLGCRAWRGYFPVGEELTLGKPDQKEGLYFGAELDGIHPLVQSRTPLHGPNLFPDLPGFRDTVLDYLDALTKVGHQLARGISLSLGLEPDYLESRYTADPLILFRIFHYPVLPEGEAVPDLWSVGEHTDYGLLTILRQDDAGGLQIKLRSTWIDAPPIPDTFVCNIGDMLDRLTGGLYRSTPHRVLNTSGRSRLSFPFFFDPAWNADVRPIHANVSVVDDREQRWDQSSVHEIRGTYGEYLMQKIGKVFPDLGDSVLG